MKRILGVICLFYAAISCTVMASEKVKPSVRPYVATSQHDTTQILAITDRPGNVQYITTLGNKGGRSQAIFGSSRGRTGGAKPATWYTPRLSSALTVEDISSLTPVGFFSGVADIQGNAITLNSRSYGQRNNPVLNAVALNSLAHAPIGGQTKLSLRETLSNGQTILVSNDVIKAAQLTLSAPGRPFCQQGRVMGKQGYVCRLRKIDTSSNIDNGGDIYFSLRTNLTMPDARYRIGTKWQKINSVVPIAALAKASYIEFFFVPPQQMNGMMLAGRVLEMEFFSRSRQALGDRIKLSVSGRELGLNKDGVTATRLKLLSIEDGVAATTYLTTQGDNAKQRIFGTKERALLWRVNQPGEKIESFSSVNPPAFFAGNTRALSNGSLSFNAAGSAKLFSLAVGQQQLLRASGRYTDKNKFMFLTSASMQSAIKLTASDDIQACRKATVEAEAGVSCTLRNYSVQGGIEGSQLRFKISGAAHGKFKVNTQWHAFNSDVSLTEFTKNGKISVFIPQNKAGTSNEALSLPTFNATFYSSIDNARGDVFKIKLTKLSGKLKAFRERKKQLNVMLINDSVSDAHFITTLSSNTVQTIYGDKTTARWYPLGRIKRAKDVNGAAIEKQFSIKRVEPNAFFKPVTKSTENALFQGVPLSAQAWSTLDSAAIGKHFPFSYTMNAKSKEWTVTQEVNKQATLRLDAPMNTSCQQATVEGVKGTVCPLRTVTLNGDIPDNVLSVAIRGGSKGARYRLNGSIWFKPEQYITVTGADNTSGMLDVFTPNNTALKIIKKVRMLVLELRNRTGGDAYFVQLKNIKADSEFTVKATSLVSTAMVYPGSESYIAPGRVEYSFSRPSNKKGMILRPSVANMNYGIKADCSDSTASNKVKVFSPIVDVAFIPSGNIQKLDLSDTSNYVEVPPYSTGMIVSYTPLVIKHFSAYCFYSNDPSYSFSFFNKDGSENSDATFFYRTRLPNTSMAPGALAYFKTISPVIVPGTDFLIEFKAVNLNPEYFTYNKYRMQCFDKIDSYSSAGIADRFYIYNDAGVLMNSGGTNWGGTTIYDPKTSFFLQDEIYYLKVVANSNAIDGTPIAIYCHPVSYDARMRGADSYFKSSWGSGKQSLYAVDSPIMAPVKTTSQQMIVITGGQKEESNLSYTLSLSDGSDVMTNIENIMASNAYSNKKYPITSSNGVIPLDAGRGNSFFIRFTPKKSAIGKILKTTYHLSSDPVENKFSNSILLIDSIYFDEGKINAPDSITYGLKGVWNFELNRKFTAEDKGFYSLKLALQHSANSASTAVIGKQVSPQVTVRYLPGGVTETIDATNFVTLSPPAGTTNIEATVTSLNGNTIDTTLGMAVESLYLKGIDGVETTSSVNKQTKLINFGLISATDTNAKEGEQATQTLTYTESKTDHNAFYLRYLPSSTAEHPVDADDYDLTDVMLQFSTGDVQHIDLSGAEVPKITVPNGSSSVSISVKIKNDNLNEWSDETGTLQASLSDSFTDPVEGSFVIKNALAPSVFDVSLAALDGGTASGNFSDTAPLSVNMELTRTESNAPKPDQEIDIKTYLERRLASSVETTAVLLGESVTMSGKTSCAFALNGSTSVTVPMLAQLSYPGADGATITSAQDCTGSIPVGIDDAEWILESKDDDTGIEVRSLPLSAKFPLDDSFSAFNSEHRGWEGTVKGHGDVRVNIRFPTP
ncbi:hypothetical protein [Aeromonas enteropelogenes]|uniref:hypothetical protein n=1 Tax=Aeromonas enteropelogenes TaxID=29489 RepID=UPI003BA18E65